MKSENLNVNNFILKRKQTILITIMMGSFLTALTQTVLTSALPSIMSDFHVTANSAQWLTTIYMLVLGIMIPATPYLINRFSTRKLFITSMTCFFLGCILSIFAPNFNIMVLSRVLQAICSGINMQLVQILMMRMYPVEERGSAMGMYGFIVGVAPAIGPTFSGYVIDSFGWKILFYILATMALLDILLASIFLENISETQKDKLDIISLVLSTMGFGGLLIGVSNQGNYGWSNSLTYAPLILGIICLIIFVIRQIKLETPLLNLKIFKSRTFTISIILILIIYTSLTSSSMLVSLYMQNMRGYSALDTGLLMLPGSILMAVLSPIAGKVFDKYGAKKVILPGFLCLGIGTLAYSFLGINTPVPYLILMYTLRMAGIAFLLMPITTWGINSLSEKDIASGSAVGSTLRQVAGSIGSAVFITIMSSVTTKNLKYMSSVLANVKGMNASFLVSAIIIFIGLILAVILMKNNEKMTIK